MDEQGGIWVARWGNGKVVRVMPDGTIDREIVIPGARNVTCCVFGGESLKAILVALGYACVYQLR